MSTLAAWSEKQSGIAQAGGGAKAQERLAYLAAMRRYLQQPPHPAVYELYRGIGGHMELPMLAIENQHDGVRNKWAEKELQDLTTEFIKAVRSEDAARGLPADTRSFDFILKKYGLERTAADAHDRPKHKQDAERLTRAMWDRYDATELLAQFKRAEEAKPALNRHDMADAFLLAMECAVRRWIMYCKEVLPRRKRGELRPDAAPLPDDPERGTIRAIGLDPGLTNVGVCLVELVGMQLPPLPEGAGADAVGASEPEPLFRVHFMDLVNFKAPAGTPLAVMHHAPETPRLLRPNYDHEDIGVLMKRALAAVEAANAAKAQRKEELRLQKEAREERKRQKAAAAADAAARGETETETPKKKKPKKRARDEEHPEDHQAAEQQQQQPPAKKQKTLIDLTEWPV